MTRFLYNDAVEPRGREGDPSDAPLRFHRTLPDYEATPLLDWPELAAELGVGRVHVKVEARRLGLPSFKVLGASWAIAGALAERLPGVDAQQPDFAALAGAADGLTLLAATDGNHGHAVARIARLLGLGSRILVPADLSAQRIEAIAAEGAEVVVVAGSYDDAVRQSARESGGDRLLISDTSWPGYEDVPARVIEGYSTIVREVDDELDGREPDLVVVQMGVGAFAAAVTRHYRTAAARPPRIVGAEPVSAACVMASLAAGRLVEVPGPHDSIAAGLNCGVPSLLAWPVLHRGLDAAVAIDDDAIRDGVRRFARAGVVAGECAGIAPAALLGLLAGPDSDFHRARLELDGSSEVLLFVTEGATDPDAYRAIVDGAVSAPGP